MHIDYGVRILPFYDFLFWLLFTEQNEHYRIGDLATLGSEISTCWGNSPIFERKNLKKYFVDVI